MKILFFDIDGVLNTHASMMYGSEIEEAHYLDPSAMVYFNHIIEKTEAKVVCCSTWRKGPQEFVENAMRKAGFKGKFHEDWRTKSFEDRENKIYRGDEVAEWMQRHPEVTRHCIVDDEGMWGRNQGSYRTGQPIVQCPSYTGLGFLEMLMAIVILNGVTDKWSLSFLSSYKKYIPRVCRNNIRTTLKMLTPEDARQHREFHKEFKSEDQWS